MKKVIPEFPDYFILDDGRVFSIKKKCFIKPIESKSGSISVSLHKKGKAFCRSVAKLVADAYIRQTNHYTNTPIHIDGNLKNNCSKNLEWGSHAEALTRTLKIKSTGFEYRDEYGQLKYEVFEQLNILISNKWSDIEIKELIPVTDEEFKAIKAKTYLSDWEKRKNEIFYPGQNL